jgi:PilZ domain
MSTEIISIVKSIPDRQPVTITITDTTGRRTELQGIYKESDPPAFFLLFPPDTIPDNIDKGRQCLCIGQDIDDGAVSFAAAVVEVPNNRVMELIAKKSIRPEDFREYFRITIKAPIEVLYDPQDGSGEEHILELDGETVDLSQTGVLSVLSDECRVKKPVMITLNLPNPAETIVCSGRVIRSKRIRKNRWLTAFHFDNLSSRSREIIAKNCFAEQRRQLRENIQTAG